MERTGTSRSCPSGVLELQLSVGRPQCAAVRCRHVDVKIDCPEGAERAAPDPLSVMCRSMPGKSRESDACPSAHLSARFGSIARLFLGVPTVAGVVEDPLGPARRGEVG